MAAKRGTPRTIGQVLLQAEQMMAPVIISAPSRAVSENSSDDAQFGQTKYFLRVSFKRRFLAFFLRRWQK
jgi:hypothetical protein